MLKLNDSIPNFSLPDQNGKIHHSTEYKGKWLVIYFYPKDDTPGCTAEACSFRDQSAELQKAGIEIIGISKDSVASHKKFAEKYHLNFTLLSDPSTELIQQFDAWGEKKFMGRAYMGIFRKTLLIDPAGKVRKIYEKVTPLNHANEIFKDWQELDKK